MKNDRIQSSQPARAATGSGGSRRISQTRDGNQINKHDAGGNIRSAGSPAIEIHIGELVLHGFAHADRRPIAEMIERELISLLVHEPFPVERSFKVARIDGGAFQLESKRPQESAGANIARVIYGGLKE